MLSCRVVTDSESALGFRLAGLEVSAVRDAQEVESVVGKIIAGGGCGILLVQEDFFDAIGEPLRRRIDRAGLPLVVPIPVGASWWSEERSMEYILRLIRRSIGYQMRIRT